MVPDFGNHRNPGTHSVNKCLLPHCLRSPPPRPDLIQPASAVLRKAALPEGFSLPIHGRVGHQERIERLNEWYRTVYMVSHLYPGFYRELQTHAGAWREWM